jgi:flavin reductase (DIM6/NTAB) family NADH-FMN oxidoreductase RutF
MKKKLGVINCLYPMPVTLVGTMIKGRANFMTIAHVGIMNYAKPHYISVSSAKTNYSNESIKENGAFSVNIPSEEMVMETDFCGIYSGKQIDKSGVFEVFFGELQTAPMIARCPLSMECRLSRIVDFQTHDLFVGEIVQSYGSEEALVNGFVDFTRVKPILFDMPTRHYWKLGPSIGIGWVTGRRWGLDKEEKA